MLLDIPRIPVSLFCVLIVTCSVCIANGGIGLHYLRSWQSDKTCATLAKDGKPKDDDQKNASPYRPDSTNIALTQDGLPSGQFAFLITITTLSSLLLVALAVWLVLRAISVSKDRKIFQELIARERNTGSNLQTSNLNKLKDAQPTIFGVNRLTASRPTAGQQAGYYLSFLSVGLLFAASASTSISIFNQWKNDTTCSSAHSPDPYQSRFLEQKDKNGRQFGGFLFLGLSMFAIIPTLIVYTIIVIEKSKNGWTKLERATIALDRVKQQLEVAKLMAQTKPLQLQKLKEIYESRKVSLDAEKKMLTQRSQILAQTRQFRNETFGQRRLVAEQRALNARDQFIDTAKIAAATAKTTVSGLDSFAREERRKFDNAKRRRRLEEMIQAKDDGWKNQAVQMFGNPEMSKDFRQQFKLKKENYGKEPTINDYQEYLLNQERINYHKGATEATCDEYVSRLSDDELKTQCYKADKKEEYEKNPERAPRARIRDPKTNAIIDNPYYVTYDAKLDTPDCKADYFRKKCNEKAQQVIKKRVLLNADEMQKVQEGRYGLGTGLWYWLSGKPTARYGDKKVPVDMNRIRGISIDEYYKNHQCTNFLKGKTQKERLDLCTKAVDKQDGWKYTAMNCDSDARLLSNCTTELVDPGTDADNEIKQKYNEFKRKKGVNVPAPPPKKKIPTQT